MLLTRSSVLSCPEAMWYTRNPNMTQTSSWLTFTLSCEVVPGNGTLNIGGSHLFLTHKVHKRLPHPSHVKCAYEASLPSWGCSHSKAQWGYLAQPRSEMWIQNCCWNVVTQQFHFYWDYCLHGEPKPPRVSSWEYRSNMKRAEPRCARTTPSWHHLCPDPSCTWSYICSGTFQFWNQQMLTLLLSLFLLFILVWVEIL